jgi:ABC-type transport system involved in cytochrome bd biosynthesis fused ATPase/permease subunit
VNATLICITHDVGETLGFPRVLVIEDGRVIEDGKPIELAQKANSRYRSLLTAESEVTQTLWSSQTWRKVHLDDGRLTEKQVKAVA